MARDGIQVSMSMEAAVYAIGACLSGIAHTDKARVAWVKERGGEVSLNGVYENHIQGVWDALEDLYVGFVASGRGSPARLAEDCLKTFREIEAREAEVPWSSWRSSGYVIRCSAHRMKLIDDEEWARHQVEWDRRRKEESAK